MRCFIRRAADAMSLLASLPTAAGRFTGENAENVPLADALKLEARMRRAQKSGGIVEVRDIVGLTAAPVTPAIGDSSANLVVESKAESENP